LNIETKEGNKIMETMDRYYTEDFDQEMLDWLTKNKPDKSNSRSCTDFYWNVNHRYLRSGFIGDLWTSNEAIYSFSKINRLTKQEFKQLIGMKEENKMSTFTKGDLKTGHLVVLRDGRECVVFKDIASVHSYDDAIVNLNNNSWDALKEYTDNLLSIDNFSELDIMEVYLQSHPFSFVREYEKDKRQLLWKREEKSEKDLQIEELQVTITQAQEQINKLKEMK